MTAELARVGVIACIFSSYCYSSAPLSSGLFPLGKKTIEFHFDFFKYLSSVDFRTCLRKTWFAFNLCLPVAYALATIDSGSPYCCAIEFHFLWFIVFSRVWLRESRKTPQKPLLRLLMMKKSNSPVNTNYKSCGEMWYSLYSCTLELPMASSLCYSTLNGRPEFLVSTIIHFWLWIIAFCKNTAKVNYSVNIIDIHS